MAGTLTVNQALAAGVAAGTGGHPKAVLRTEKGRTIVLPYAPRTTTIDGLAAPFTVTPRPGRKPLTQRDGDQLTTLALTLTIARPDHNSSVEDYIADLAEIAAGGLRVTLLNMSSQERGPWRITGLTVGGELRQYGTNAITRATVTLALTEASDANPKVGPVSGGTKGKGAKVPKTYTVKKGDTLRSIAEKFYGDPADWQRIAKLNGIKDPDALKAGRTLKLPPAPKGGGK